VRVAAALAAAFAVLTAGAAHAGRTAHAGKNGLIAFVRGGDIWTIRPDGTGLTRLTRTAVHEANPSWSPDGTKLAFDDGRGAIYAMNADGSQRVDLSAAGVDPDTQTCDSNPTWAPDGKHIAFSFITDDCTGAAGALGTMASDGTKRRVLEEDYSGILGGDDQPAWGPGGGRIAFTRSDSERMASGPYDYDIWILDARTGKALRPLTHNYDSTSPAWRPNGKQIAFTGPKGITVMTAAGKSPHLLGLGSEPAWSPDSGSVAYIGEDGLRVIRTNGSRARRLLLRCPRCSSPTWQSLPS
jgi:Tol biopolymer transport system component